MTRHAICMLRACCVHAAGSQQDACCASRISAQSEWHHCTSWKATRTTATARSIARMAQSADLLTGIAAPAMQACTAVACTRSRRSICRAATTWSSPTCTMLGHRTSQPGTASAARASRGSAVQAGPVRATLQALPEAGSEQYQRCAQCTYAVHCLHVQAAVSAT